MEKVAMGMGLPAVAACGLNDQVAEHPGMGKIPPDPGFFRLVKFKIGLKNFLCRLGLFPYRLLCCIVFKQIPPPEIIQKLKDAGFQYTELPDNPYV